MSPVTRTRISESEWTVLQVLWARQELSGADVVAALQATTPWKPTTIKTLLSRLVKKQVVGFRVEGPGYLYFPLVSEAACAAHERQSFLEKVYRGDRRSLVAAFLTDERLSADDIEALKQLLEDRRPT